MGNKWVYCAMGSQNILNNSPFANHPLYRVFTHAIANLFFSSSICSARRNGNLVEIMEDLSPTEGSRILKILLDAIYDVRSKRILYSWRGRSGPWLGRKWCNTDACPETELVCLHERIALPSVPIKRHGSVIAEIVRGRYAKRRFRSFIAIENVGQERRMRGKASTFPAIEKKEKFLPVLFFFYEHSILVRWIYEEKLKKSFSVMYSSNNGIQTRFFVTLLEE